MVKFRLVAFFYGIGPTLMITRLHEHARRGMVGTIAIKVVMHSLERGASTSRDTGARKSVGGPLFWLSGSSMS